MKTLKLLAILFLIALPAYGILQTVTPTPPTRVWPDVMTPGQAAAVADTAWVANTQGYLQQDGTDIWNLQQTVTSPTIGNQALEAQIVALQQQVAALTPVTPPPPVTVAINLTTLTPGPLSGSVANIGWNTGMWTATANGVSAVMQGSRNFVLPAGQTLLSVTIDCPTNACSGTFTDSAGETVGFSMSQGSITTLGTGWSKVSGAVSLQMISGPATGLLLQQMSWN